ncbi:hypothetical protein [Streptomyces sp. SID7909]|nr:hypothetical protein [Streptomyces sp. SID7909]
MVLAIGSLAGLGATLGKVLAGRMGLWAAAMGVGGIAVTRIGVSLHIA